MAYENPLSNFFFASDQKNVPQGLRQKIALAMLMQKRAYPKTFGEGLAAIGDAIGDRYGILGIERDAAAAEAAGQKARDVYSGTTPPVASNIKASSYAPTDSVEPGAPQSPVVATIQQQHPDLLQNQKQPLVTTPPAAQSLSTMFNPEPYGKPSSFSGSQAPGPDAGYNSLDAAAGAPQPGQPGVTPSRFATVRNNNPGGAYPTKDAGAFGSTGQEIIGGGHPIAKYPTPVHGAAANMALLQRNYTGMPVGAAISKWSGGGRSSLPGYDSNAIITPEMASDPRLMQAIASGEAPGQYPMSPEQWQMASQWARAGGAPAVEGGRDRAAAILASQQQPPAPQAFSPQASAGPAGLPPEITGGASQPDQRLAFNGAQPPAPSQQIRTAPPLPQAQIQQAPPPGQPQQSPGPGYVLKLGPEPTPPPTMTDGMRRIQNIIRNTPPSQRESVKEALANDYANEQAKLAQQNVIYQDELKSRHEMRKLQEEQRQKADKDIRDARTDSQKWITTAPAAGTVGGGPQGADPRLGTPQSPQRQGPTIGPVPAGDIPERWSKQEAEKIEKQKESYQKAQPELTETLDIIDKINKHPAKPYATGMFSGVTALTPSGKGFTALNEQLMGKNLVDAYQKLQGTGQIGEKEGANFAKARARLTAAASEADYNEALKDLSDTVRGTLERAQRNLKMPVTAWQKTNDDAYAPDVGEVQKGHEYLGGDPGNPRSWRKAR